MNRLEHVGRKAGAVCCWLVGLVLLAGVVGLASGIPDGVRTERAYSRAEPCAAHEHRGTASSCLYEAPATVTGKVIKGGRYSEYTLDLRAAAPVPGTISLGDDEPLLKDLDEGDEITVTMWRDYATAVSRDGVTQVSTESPEGEPEFMTGFALVVSIAAAYFFYAGFVLFGRGPHSLVEGLVNASVAAGCVVVAGFVGAATAAGPWATLAAWVLLTPPAVATARVWRRRRPGRHRGGPLMEGPR